MTVAEPEDQLSRLAGELASNRARLEHLVRSSPAVIYCVDAGPPYRLTFVSENVARVYGVTAEELLATQIPYGGRLHPDDAAAVAADRERLLAEGRLTSEYRLRRDDGSWGWTRDDQIVVRDGDGRPAEIVGSLLDVTDRKRTEERAERLQELTAGLAAALTPEQVAASALLPALSVLKAQGVALILKDPADPGRLRVAGAAGYPAELVEGWDSLPLDGSTPAGEAVLTGEACYAGSVEEARARYPAMFRVPSALGQHAWAGLPLRNGDVVIGALAVGFADRQDFPEPERRFLETVAAQCALAVERTRLYGTAATERERLAAVLSRLPVGVIIAEAPSGRLVLGNAESSGSGGTRSWPRPRSASTTTTTGSIPGPTGRTGRRSGRWPAPCRPGRWSRARRWTSCAGTAAAAPSSSTPRRCSTRTGRSAPRSARSSTSPSAPRPAAASTPRTRPSGRPGPRPRPPASGWAGCSRSPAGWPRR